MRDGCKRDTAHDVTDPRAFPGMLSACFGFCSSEFLPRRLLPLLLLLEVVQLLRRWQTRDERVIDGHAVVVPPRAVTEPPAVDRR